MGFYTDASFYPDVSVGYLIRTINQLALPLLDDALAEEGLSSVQWSAMIALRYGRADTCATLARDLAHDKGAMTRLIDTLEEKGLVRRERAEGDRRLNLLTLTPAGMEVALRGKARVIACWNSWMRDWSPDEAERFIAQLQKLRRTLEGAPACAA